jgi:hypothetical protein
VGSVDSIGTVGADGVHVAGWALDPDTAGPIDVHVYIDGVGYVVRADTPRPDLAPYFPGYSTAHGFDAVLHRGTTGGIHSLCVFAINVAGGANSTLQCRSV